MTKKFFANKPGLILPVLLLGALLTGCATYYMQNGVFNQYFLEGDFVNAEKALDQNKKNTRNKNRALYLLNKGTLAWIQQDYTSATNYFNEADLFIEDQRKKIGSEALSLLTNPSIKPYMPEDFENVMLHFYKALSYLELGNRQAALVECRRVNEKLYALNDKYPQNYKNRYSDDAFAHMLMGLIFDAMGDSNNAFIAYRNAFNIYENIYLKNFNTPAPHQLKEDILRTAFQTGLEKEHDFYRNKFGFDFKRTAKSDGDLIFIWITGLGPVKDEWSINFNAVNGRDGFITIMNSDEGLSFPFFVGDMDRETRNSFSDLDLIRVAFPKYQERPPVYTDADIWVNDSVSYHLDKGQDLNSIAFKTLRDRMLRETANSLLRLATKQAVKQYMRSQDGNLGTIVSIVNAVTEKADTRNWQTLPHSIHYTRLRLKEGNNKVTLRVSSPSGELGEHEFDIVIEAGKTNFFTFHNMESN